MVSATPSPSAIPTAPDTMAAMINMIMEKSLNWSANLWNSVFFLAVFNWFSPYFSCLFFTSSLSNPFS